MYLWCENCQEKTQTLAGKYDINICNQCGCEVRSTQNHLIALQTQSLLEKAGHIDEDGFLGQFGSMTAGLEELSNAPAPVEKLVTAKYLPANFYDQEVDLAEEVAALDESWPEDNLIEKIQRLEDSLRPKPTDKPKENRQKLIRVDMGHVATQRDIEKATGRSEKFVEADQDKPLPMARKLGELKDIRIDAVEIPVAEPSGDEALVMRSQITSLGLVATWSVQLFVGVAFASSLPVTVWGFWVAAQIGGSICLCGVLYNLFASQPKAVTHRKMPRAPVGSSVSRNSRIYQD